MIKHTQEWKQVFSLGKRVRVFLKSQNSTKIERCLTSIASLAYQEEACAKKTKKDL